MDFAMLSSKDINSVTAVDSDDRRCNVTKLGLMLDDDTSAFVKLISSNNWAMDGVTSYNSLFFSGSIIVKCRIVHERNTTINGHTHSFSDF
jgi:hypothetical protein